MTIKFVVTVDADVVIIGIVVAVSLLSGRPMRKKNRPKSLACTGGIINALGGAVYNFIRLLFLVDVHGALVD